MRQLFKPKLSPQREKIEAMLRLLGVPFSKRWTSTRLQSLLWECLSGTLDISLVDLMSRSLKEYTSKRIRRDFDDLDGLQRIVEGPILINRARELGLTELAEQMEDDLNIETKTTV
jgi:hypothetical protein